MHNDSSTTIHHHQYCHDARLPYSTFDTQPNPPEASSPCAPPLQALSFRHRVISRFHPLRSASSHVRPISHEMISAQILSLGQHYQSNSSCFSESQPRHPCRLARWEHPSPAQPSPSPITQYLALRQCLSYMRELFLSDGRYTKTS